MAVRILGSFTPGLFGSPNSDGDSHQRVPGRLRLSFPKPSWVVRTESNVHREVRKNPDPPCEDCGGNGRASCRFCRGKGRTNSVDMQMLPKGKWPKWCKTCGGSGLTYCIRCVGTGEYRGQIGFGLLKRDSGHTGNSDVLPKRRTVDELFESMFEEESSIS